MHYCASREIIHRKTDEKMEISFDNANTLKCDTRKQGEGNADVSRALLQHPQGISRRRPVVSGASPAEFNRVTSAPAGKAPKIHDQQSILRSLNSASSDLLNKCFRFRAK
jgi:hypothetical protein